MIGLSHIDINSISYLSNTGDREVPRINILALKNGFRIKFPRSQATIILERLPDTVSDEAFLLLAKMLCAVVDNENNG